MGYAKTLTASSQGVCPQCSTDIPRYRYIGKTAVCQCGWSDPRSEISAQVRAEKIKISAMMVLAVAMIVSYAHLVSWGSYALQIPFVKIQQMTGTISKAGLTELAQACVELNKWTCAKKAYSQIYSQKQDAGGLALRARLEGRLGETENAMASFGEYFAAGGKDSENAYLYGSLLERSGHLNEAVQSYEFAAANIGDFLPWQATAGIVRVLMKQGKNEEALARIIAFQGSAENASGYLSAERAELEALMKNQEPQKTAAVPSKAKP